MTQEEAEKISVIASEVDGGCPNCVQSVVRKLIKDFPKFDWVKMVAKAGEFDEEEIA